MMIYFEVWNFFFNIKRVTFGACAILFESMTTNGECLGTTQGLSVNRRQFVVGIMHTDILTDVVAIKFARACFCFDPFPAVLTRT